MASGLSPSLAGRATRAAARLPPSITAHRSKSEAISWKVPRARTAFIRFTTKETDTLKCAARQNSSDK
jgi:hypothetical protein